MKSAGAGRSIDWCTVSSHDFSISGAFAKMTCPTCDQAVKRAVGKRSQAKDHGTKLEPLWTIVIGDWTSPFVRIFAFVSLGERLSGDCLGEASEETAWIIFCPMFFFMFHVWRHWRSLPLPSMPWMKCFDPRTTSVHCSRWSRRVGKFLGNFHSKKWKKWGNTLAKNLQPQNNLTEINLKAKNQGRKWSLFAFWKSVLLFFSRKVARPVSKGALFLLESFMSFLSSEIQFCGTLAPHYFWDSSEKKAVPALHHLQKLQDCDLWRWHAYLDWHRY